MVFKAMLRALLLRSAHAGKGASCPELGLRTAGVRELEQGASLLALRLAQTVGLCPFAPAVALEFGLGAALCQGLLVLRIRSVLSERVRERAETPGSA